MSTTLQSLHDFMLEGKPEGASHDASTCPFCVTGEVASATSNGGNVSDKTYTEQEINDLLAKVSGLEAKVTELTASSEATELDQRIAEAKAELETQVTDLQSKLDAAMAESGAHKKNYDELTEYLDTEVKAAAEAAALEGRKAERVEAVKEVASFSDEYLDANAERFAAMSDEAFAAAIEDWKVVAEAASAKPASEKKTELPAATAMTAARDNTTDDNPLHEVLSLRSMGVDARTVF